MSQLKKRLTVGAAFEIETINKELQQRRVIKAQTNAIGSIVPFDADKPICYSKYTKNLSGGQNIVQKLDTS